MSTKEEIVCEIKIKLEEMIRQIDTLYSYCSGKKQNDKGIALWEARYQCNGKKLNPKTYKKSQQEVNAGGKKNNNAIYKQYEVRVLSPRDSKNIQHLSNFVSF